MTTKKKTWEDMDEFTRQYAESALWSSVHYTTVDGEECDEPLDKNHGVEDLSAECIEQMTKDCDAFREANEGLLEKANEMGLGEGSCGHDFWLTRNGHGAGFWDRGIEEVGDKLTEACKAYGEVYLDVGDDGKLYIS